MKSIRILTAVAAVVLAGCQAQEGVPQAAAVPGLPPTAIPDVVVVQTDSTNNPINALANDIDLSGTGLTITAVTVDQTLPPLAGAVATTNGTTVTFTPPATFVGVVTLLYNIADGDGGTSSGAIAVSVLPVALPPVAVPDAAVITQDSGANDIDVLANDVDLSGGGLTLTSATIAQSLPPATHTVAVVADEVRFTPAAAFVGVVVVNYVATDANGETANGVLTVVVSPLAVPTGPVPLPDVVTVAQNSPAANHDVLANDVNPAGGAGLTVTNVTVTSSLPNVAHTVSINSNQVRFTPAANFAGVVLVTYEATDINGDSANGVLTVVVSPLALQVGPVTIPDVAVVAQDSPAVNHDVLANDVNIVGGALTVTAVSVTSSLPNVAQTVSINNNQVRFAPAATFSGVVVISYTATNVNGASAPGVFTIVVTPAGLTVGPVPVPDAAVVMENSSNNLITVLANDIDPAGGGLTLTNVTVTGSVPPGAHTVGISGSQVQFTPEASFAGSVVITYTATDSGGSSANGALNVVVSPLALPVGLVAIPDVAVVAQDSGVTPINVLANDIDVVGGGLTLTNVSVFSSTPAGLHTATIAGNQVQFTPAAAFAGVVVLSYTAADTGGSTANGLVNITVTPAALVLGVVAIPDPVVAQSSAGVQSFNVVANDVNPAGGALTLSLINLVSEVPGSSGAFAIVGNQVQYTPSALYVGLVQIDYTVTDINGKTSVGRLAITVSL